MSTGITNTLSTWIKTTTIILIAVVVTITILVKINVSNESIKYSDIEISAQAVKDEELTQKQQEAQPGYTCTVKDDHRLFIKPLSTTYSPLSQSFSPRDILGYPYIIVNSTTKSLDSNVSYILSSGSVYNTPSVHCIYETIGVNNLYGNRCFSQYINTLQGKFSTEATLTCNGSHVAYALPNIGNDYSLIYHINNPKSGSYYLYTISHINKYGKRYKMDNIPITVTSDGGVVFGFNDRTHEYVEAVDCRLRMDLSLDEVYESDNRLVLQKMLIDSFISPPRCAGKYEVVHTYLKDNKRYRVGKPVEAGSQSIPGLVMAKGDKNGNVNSCIFWRIELPNCRDVRLNNYTIQELHGNLYAICGVIDAQLWVDSDKLCFVVVDGNLAPVCAKLYELNYVHDGSSLSCTFRTVRFVEDSSRRIHIFSELETDSGKRHEEYFLIHLILNRDFQVEKEIAFKSSGSNYLDLRGNDEQIVVVYADNVLVYSICNDTYSLVKHSLYLRSPSLVNRKLQLINPSDELFEPCEVSNSKLSVVETASLFYDARVVAYEYDKYVEFDRARHEYQCHELGKDVNVVGMQRYELLYECSSLYDPGKIDDAQLRREIEIGLSGVDRYVYQTVEMSDFNEFNYSTYETKSFPGCYDQLDYTPHWTKDNSNDIVSSSTKYIDEIGYLGINTTLKALPAGKYFIEQVPKDYVQNPGEYYYKAYVGSNNQTADMANVGYCIASKELFQHVLHGDEGRVFEWYFDNSDDYEDVLDVYDDLFMCKSYSDAVCYINDFEQENESNIYIVYAQQHNDYLDGINVSKGNCNRVFNVSISSYPKDARIKIFTPEGVMLYHDSGILREWLEEGSYKIQIARDGYTSQDEWVLVEKNIEITREYHLSEIK